MHLVVCATFFDGLLSADAKALWLYEEAKRIIRYFEEHVDEEIKRHGKRQKPERIYGTESHVGVPTHLPAAVPVTDAVAALVNLGYAQAQAAAAIAAAARSAAALVRTPKRRR
jgi:Holliday junction resolvasome RuvABC DNA-binding subunit